uniref:Uncharacterized protein n=1 Tax=Agrobacterium tumefaciens TaxID=358 RepID=A0A3S6IC62_AGRTU|nr:hypothetical protein AgrTiEU6_176 [Agrobacterium tumefaciens]
MISHIVNVDDFIFLGANGDIPTISILPATARSQRTPRQPETSIGMPRLCFI